MGCITILMLGYSTQLPPVSYHSYSLKSSQGCQEAVNMITKLGTLNMEFLPH